MEQTENNNQPDPSPGRRGPFDWNRTLTLIKGAVFEPEPTWERYLPEADDWQKTAALLTGPLVVGAALLSYVLSLILPSQIPFYSGPTFGDMLLGIVFGLIGAALAAFIVSFLAGLFKGRGSFARGLAATTLAFVPGYFGQVALQLPWIGWLLGLALFIYSLVLLWRIIPKYLEVPAPSRTGHYLLSLATLLVAGLVIGLVTGASAPDRGFNMPDDRDVAGSGRSSGMFGEMERQGKLMEAAESDRYEPPANGKLTKKQVEQYISVMTKTKALRESQSDNLKALSERAESEDTASVGDIFSGIGGVLQMTTAEMEVVKTGGGNWAEHQWVKEQLRIAMIQQDINDAVKHNYELYQEYEEELSALNR